MTITEFLEARIAEIEASLDAATPGPWANGGNGYIETVPVVDPHRFDIMPETVARVELKDEDADLIANAPTFIAYLLSELKKATK